MFAIEHGHLTAVASPHSFEIKMMQTIIRID